MTDPTPTPTYLTLTQAAKLIPTSSGKPPSTQTIFRWATKGCRGVKLECRRFGRRMATTHEALDQFSRELAAAWAADPEPPQRPRKPTAKRRTPQEREAASEAALGRLKAAGVDIEG